MPSLSPLTPIGFDVPQVAPLPINAPPKLAEASTTGTAVIAQAGEQQQRMLQSQQQYAQTTAQMAQQTAEAQAASSKAIANAASMASSAVANRAAKNAQSLGNLTQTLSDMSRQYAERDERQRKAEAEAAKAEKERLQAEAKAEAVDRLEKLQSGWIEKGFIETQGSEAYRAAVTNTISRYDLPPETIVDLTQKYYGPGLEYAKRTEENRQKTAADVVAQQRRIDSQKLRNNISASLGTLAQSTGLSTEQVNAASENVNSSLEAFMKDETVPLVNRYAAVADAMEAAGKTIDSANVKAAEIRSNASAYRQVAEYAAEQMQLVNTDALPFSQYEANVKQRAAELGISFDVPDPQADQKFLQQGLNGEAAIRELQQKKALAGREAITANDQVIGALATEAALVPSAYAELKRAAAKGGNVNATAALESVDAFVKFRDNDTPQYRLKRKQLEGEMVAVTDNFNTWFVSQTKPKAQRSPAVDAVLTELRSRGITPELLTEDPNSGRITPEQLALVQKGKADLINVKREEMIQLDQNYKNQYQQFQRVGLSLDVGIMKNNRKAYQTKLDEYQQQLQQSDANSLKYEPPGVSPNFNGGAPGKSPKTGPLLKRTYLGKTITSPIIGQNGRAYTDTGSGGEFGAPRPNRTHAGLDFPVPSGSQAVSLVYGTVFDVQPNDVGGYGKFVEILGDDGFLYLYAHNARTVVTKGERVGPGQLVSITGNTGVGTGPHLHLEVAAADAKGNRLGNVDPLQHLSTRSFGGPPKQPRTSGSTGNARPFMPKGAIPLGGNTYLLNGKAYTLPPQATRPVARPANYSKSQPLMSSYASRNAADYPPSSLEANHGYTALAKDRQFARALNTVARNLRIPGQWLADLIAYESAGTFDPGVPNGLGYYGLIQFGPEARQDLGVTLDQLTAMSPAQQMTMVEKYLRLQMRYAGVSQLKGPEWLVAAVNQGNVVLRDVDRRGANAVLDPQNADGAGTTLKYYMETLGKYSGRQYDYLGNRSQRLSAVVHTRPNDGCPTCQAMMSQTAFVPHQDTTSA